MSPENAWGLVMEGLDPLVGADHQAEVARRRRFRFGRNWQSYAKRVDEVALLEAQRSLTELLPATVMQGGRLDGRTFLDAGCGSGLFSAAALRMGADVTAFDFDPDSVRTTRSMVDTHVRIEDAGGSFELRHGSVLDPAFLDTLGTFDIVYSWGVLHHTGAMWEACRLVAERVRSGGVLVIALYHDAGVASRAWLAIKRIYVALPAVLQVPFAALLLIPIELVALVRSLLRFRLGDYVRRWTGYRSLRGMSRWHDHLDWVGGYPYEWSSPAETVAFFAEQGFAVNRVIDAVAWGNNEFVFIRK